MWRVVFTVFAGFALLLPVFAAFLCCRVLRLILLGEGLEAPRHVQTGGTLLTPPSCSSPCQTQCSAPDRPFCFDSNWRGWTSMRRKKSISGNN